MKLISCRQVAFSYEGNTVLSDISFEVNSGDYLCVVGENGAGKSTLVKGLLHLKKVSGGEIEFQGLKQDEIGYLPQQTLVQKDFPASVYEVVLSGRLNRRGLLPFYAREDKREALRQLKQLGIEQLKDRCFRELSGGQQQRALLARALCATKKLLLLDEPATGLDPVMTNDFYSLLYKINREQNITIIMVSHDVHSAVRYASHILHLGKSQLFYGNTRDYIVSEPGLKFLGGKSDD
jgi:zinc transport system ATP-binding protein